jgi:hypothetical protein
MPLTREERKLLHQKSKQPTFGVNKPDPSEGREGDIAYRKIEGSGTVQYLKQSGEWIALSSSGSMPSSRDIIPPIRASSSNSHGSLTGLGSDQHTQYLLVDGTRAMSGNLSLGGNDIGSVDALDVNGHTTLDKTTIDTTDGAFSVSGSNPISLITTGSNDIDINTNQTLDVDINEDYEMYVRDLCNWDTSTVDWDNSSTFDLTSLGDTTIETQGTTSAPKTLSLLGGKSDFTKYGLIFIANYNKIDESGDSSTNFSANGIHIKTDAGDTSAKHNNILIEQTNQNTKGAAFGILLKSHNGIKLQTRANNATQKTAMILEASGSLDIGLGQDTIGVNQNPSRTKVHGIFETSNLYRPLDDRIITTDIGTNTTDTDGNPGNATGEHVRFQALDTYNLIRTVSRVVKNTTVLFTDATCDTTSGDATVTFTSTGNANAGLISDGMKVTGTGIPTDSFVTSKTTSSFELRDAGNNPVNATANGTNVTLSFFNYTNTLYDNDFILIATIIDNDDDDAIGTMWKISITYQAGGNDLAQVWYCAKQSAKFAWLGNSNGLALSANDKGIVTWTSTNGIRWQNATGGTVTSVRCSALKIHSGTEDF